MQQGPDMLPDNQQLQSHKMKEVAPPRHQECKLEVQGLRQFSYPHNLLLGEGCAREMSGWR